MPYLYPYIRSCSMSCTLLYPSLSNAHQRAECSETVEALHTVPDSRSLRSEVSPPFQTSTAATPWSHRRGCTSWPFARDRCDLSDTRGTEAHCPASTSFPYRVNAPSTIQLHTATEFAAVGQKHSQIEEKDGNDYQRLIVVQYGRWE